MKEGEFSTKWYDKRDGFNFSIMNEKKHFKQEI